MVEQQEHTFLFKIGQKVFTVWATVDIVAHEYDDVTDFYPLWRAINRRYRFNERLEVIYKGYTVGIYITGYRNTPLKNNDTTFDNYRDFTHLEHAIDTILTDYYEEMYNNSDVSNEFPDDYDPYDDEPYKSEYIEHKRHPNPERAMHLF